MYNTETTHKEYKNKDFHKRNPEKSAKAVISLALSVINLYYSPNKSVAA